VPVRPAAPGRHYKPAAVRLYLDADVLGLAHVIAGLRHAGAECTGDLESAAPEPPDAAVRSCRRPSWQ